MLHLDEAERLCAAFRHSFVELFPRIVGARFEERTGYMLAICPGIPFPGFNGLRAEGPGEPMRVEQLATAIGEVDRAGVPCWIVLRAGRLDSVEREARRLGFTEEEFNPAMALRTDDFSVGPGSQPSIVVVRDEAGLSVAADLAAAGFGTPREPFVHLYTPAVATAPGTSIYVAYANGVPVSTSCSWVGDGAVGIFNVATPAEHRGRGYGGAVTARAVRDGFAAGADLAWLHASPLGEPVYRRLGFRQVDTYLILGRPETG